MTVQIHLAQVASIISHNNSIRIEHRDNFEDEIFSQDLRDCRVAQQIVNDILDDKRCHSLAWVNSRCQEHSFFLFSVVEVTDDEMVTVISCNCLAKSLLLDKMLSFGINFKRVKIALESGVSVWIAVSDIDGVVVILMKALIR